MGCRSLDQARMDHPVTDRDEGWGAARSIRRAWIIR
jgi:hypothetical protein